MSMHKHRGKSKPESTVEVEITRLAVEDFYQLLNETITHVIIRYGEGISRIKEAERTWIEDGFDCNALSSLPLLESVRISLPLLKGISLNNVASLRKCEQLKSLDLENIRELNFKHLKNCDDLEKIRFNAYYKKYIDMTPLRKCRSLKSIDVTRPQPPPRLFIGSSGGKHGLIGIRLPSSDSIEHIDLSNNLFVSKYMLTMYYKHMAEGVKKKHLLDLSQLRKSSNLTWLRISNNPRLLAIDLSELEGNDQLTVDLRMTPVRAYRLGNFSGKVIFGRNPDRRLV